jgi:hypothetical protein
VPTGPLLVTAAAVSSPRPPLVPVLAAPHSARRRSASSRLCICLACLLPSSSRPRLDLLSASFTGSISCSLVRPSPGGRPRSGPPRSHPVPPGPARRSTVSASAVARPPPPRPCLVASASAPRPRLHRPLVLIPTAARPRPRLHRPLILVLFPVPGHRPHPPTSPASATPATGEPRLGCFLSRPQFSPE